MTLRHMKIFLEVYKTENITQAARLFYTYALHLVSTLEEMEQGLRNWEELGQIRVGTTITVGNYLLPQVLKHNEATLTAAVASLPVSGSPANY